MTYYLFIFNISLGIILIALSIAILIAKIALNIHDKREKAKAKHTYLRYGVMNSDYFISKYMKNYLEDRDTKK